MKKETGEATHVTFGVEIGEKPGFRPDLVEDALETLKNAGVGVLGCSPDLLRAVYSDVDEVPTGRWRFCLYQEVEKVDAERARVLRWIDEGMLTYSEAEIIKGMLVRGENEIVRLRGLLHECNAVCLCGCPASEHESYGEDGESCGVEGHECLRVAPAVLEIVQRERDGAKRAVVDLGNVLYNIETGERGAAEEQVREILAALEKRGGRA